MLWHECISQTIEKRIDTDKSTSQATHSLVWGSLKSVRKNSTWFYRATHSFLSIGFSRAASVDRKSLVWTVDFPGNFSPHVALHSSKFRNLFEKHETTYWYNVYSFAVISCWVFITAAYTELRQNAQHIYNWHRMYMTQTNFRCRSRSVKSLAKHCGHISNS